MEIQSWECIDPTREVIRTLLSFFHSEPGNGHWKRQVYAAFLKCTPTIKSFFEETLAAIPDSILDSPITQASIGFPDVFVDSKRLLPPPCIVPEEELLYA